MEDKKDLLETLTGVTNPSQIGLEPKNITENKSQYYCDALTDENINDVLEDYDSHLVTLVGFSEVGKSTFVSSFYHTLMCTGEIDGYKFLDSDTFVGFERRAYIRNEALRTSKRNSRTSQIEGHFLTLILQKEGKIKKLIISDRAGETYKNNYTSNIVDVQKDKGLIYSQHIIFFIDSVSMNNEDLYFDFNDKFQFLLGRMSAAGVFASNKVYDIIFNKVDLNQTHREKQLFKDQSQNLLNMLKDDFKLNISNIFEITSNKMKDKSMHEAFKYIVNTLGVKSLEQCARINWVETFLNE